MTREDFKRHYENEQGDYLFKAFLPFLYVTRSSGGRHFTTCALVYFKTRDENAFTSFVYYFPFYGRETRGHSSVRHFLLYPLYARRVDKEADLYILDLLWPIFHYEKSPEKQVLRILPYLIPFFLFYTTLIDEDTGIARRQATTSACSCLCSGPSPEEKERITPWSTTSPSAFLSSLRKLSPPEDLFLVLLL